MKHWMSFEDDCVKYLQDKYSGLCKIIAAGKADSTKSDIWVQTKSSVFYIEVKQSEAHSGQFVLLPDREKNMFVFSPENKTVPTDGTRIIMDYMNENFAHFKEPGTAGQRIDISSDVFYNWIEHHYASKSVKYFITKGQDFIIFPVSRFRHYFAVSATYRIKRSGSSSPAIKNQTNIISMLKDEYSIASHFVQGKQLFVLVDGSISKTRFRCGKYEYYLAEKEAGKYEVRKLSNTYNMNVIFSVFLKASQSHDDIKRFENELV